MIRDGGMRPIKEDIKRVTGPSFILVFIVNLIAGMGTWKALLWALAVVGASFSPWALHRFAVWVQDKRS